MDTNSKIQNLNRWTPYDFKNGMVAKNRVVVPAMASATATVDGDVTQKTIQHYQHLSRSGAGLLFVEYTYIHKSGRSEPQQLGLSSNEQMLKHQELASAIKQLGLLAGIQLVHSGGKSSSDLTGGLLLGPSAVRVPVKDDLLEVPKEMNADEIKSYQQWYLTAAIRAAQAGYDVIELHAAHGYGLNQWLSPLTNHRMDAYGGDIVNRSRMLLEIFQSLRKELPDKIIGVRIPGEDHFSQGLDAKEMIVVSQKLQELGADFIDVSSGIGGWRRPQQRTGEGYLLPEAAVIQEKLQIPVIGVGGIESGGFIDQAITMQKVGFTAVGRKILKGAELFFEEVLSEKAMDKDLECQRAF